MKKTEDKVRYDSSLVCLLNEIPDKGYIKAVVIGETTAINMDGFTTTTYPLGKMLPWEFVFSIADKIIIYTPVYVWTRDWVYFMAEYDGSVWLVRVPRNPVDTMPEFSGEDIPSVE